MCKLSFCYSSEALTIAGQVLGSFPQEAEDIPAFCQEIFLNCLPYPLLLAFLVPWSLSRGAGRAGQEPGAAEGPEGSELGVRCCPSAGRASGSPTWAGGGCDGGNAGAAIAAESRSRPELPFPFTFPQLVLPEDVGQV